MPFKNKDAQKAYDRSTRKKQVSKRCYLKLKADVMAHLGGECEACGNTDLDVLTVDHLWGGGNEKRRRVGIHSGTAMYLALRRGRHSYDGLRCLCFNCQIKARRYGPYMSLWPRYA